MISITIEDNGAVSMKTTKGVAETEMAAEIIVEAMRNLHAQEMNTTADYSANIKSKLVLVASNPDKKLWAVKEIKETLNLGLKESKDLIDKCTGDEMVVLSRGKRSEMTILRDKFDPSIVQVKVINDKEWQ